jgi:16S rRNA (uracil1498-N3)-methyltransferase
MPPRRHRPRTSGDEPEQVLYVEEAAAPDSIARITGGEAAHARRSLRLRAGDGVVLVDGKGKRYHGSITEIGKTHLDVAVSSEESIVAWPSRELWLGAGVLRSTRMDTIVEKASELGVKRLIPLLLEHCVARPQGEGTKLDRWQRIAVESLKQSKRAQLMDVEVPTDLEAFLEALPPSRSLWVADPDGEAPGEAAREPSEGPLILVVGPEGGVSPSEIEQLRDSGAKFIRLGGNRLRAETAALALVTAGLLAHGELDPPDGD